MVILHSFHCTCSNWPYFHFRSKIWHHHPVAHPWLRNKCENFGDSICVH